MAYNKRILRTCIYQFNVFLSIDADAKGCRHGPIITRVTEKKPKIVVFRPVKSDRFIVNDNGQLRVEKVANITTDKSCTENISN